MLKDNDLRSPHAGTPTTTLRDGLGRTVEVQELLSATGDPVRTSYEYDSLGRLIRMIDDHGNIHRRELDLLGRTLRISHPDSGVSTMTYDGAGNLLTRTDARGKRVEYSYDEVNRKLSQWDSDDPVGTRVIITYDGNGQCTECLNPEGMADTVSYPLLDGLRATDRLVRDPRGRLIATHSDRAGTRFTVRDEFDNADRNVRTIYPGGYEIARDFDGANRVIRIPGFVNGATFSERGQLEVLELANDVTRRIEYDSRQRVVEIATESDREQLDSYQFSLDRSGNVTSVHDRRPLRDEEVSSAGTFTYDSLYRLRSAVLDGGRSNEEQISYTIDRIGNMTEKLSDRGASSPAHVGEMTYGDEISGAGPHALSGYFDAESGVGGLWEYDASGNVLSRGELMHEWDYLGRLTGVRDRTGVTRKRATHTVQPTCGC